MNDSGQIDQATQTTLAASAEHSNPRLVYDLRGNEGSSDAYYAESKAIADALVDRIEQCAGVVLDDYGRFVRESLLEAPRSRGEFAIELLTLGMALKRYESASVETPRWVVALAQCLLWVRRRSQILKSMADATRAVIAKLFLMPAIGSQPTPSGSAVERLASVIAWLKATGEYEQEVLRLSNWVKYLGTLGTYDAAECMNSASELFERFEREAAERLGPYTQGVGVFLKGEYTRRGCREDSLFCGRAAAEYHLNMIAAEVMNRGLRASFERTGRRVVLVPACMRGAKVAHCRAHIDSVDTTCTACDPQCTVNRITRRMRGTGAEVYLVPHSSGFSRWLDRWEREPGVGVTAVACMLNILPGGYEMSARGIASQCVPLDYPGCRKHWDRVGIPTAVNEARLVQIVGTPTRG